MIRQMKHGGVVLAALLALLAVSFDVKAQGVVSADDNARVLAGLPPSSGSPLEALTKEESWQAHAKYFDKAWSGLEERQLSKIKTWSTAHIAHRKPVLFYMFSGPDFLYANAFFEGASTYVLSGLEPVGQVPDLAALPGKSLGGELRSLQNSLNSVLSFSFFITKKMKTELRDGRLTGTLPILYTFLARSGKTVKDAMLVSLNPDGTVTPLTGDIAKGASPGAKITFTTPGGTDQTLYYFNTDISNHGLKTSGFLTFCKGLGQGDSFVKSASYLMHSDNFSGVRSFLVDNTSTLVQDDSGVPLRFLDEKAWRVTPFGRYLNPISIFSRKTYQPNMRQLFTKSAQPLDFCLGYRWRPKESNLLLAVKEPGARAEATP